MSARRFLRETRAGATAIVAVAMSAVVLGGVALVGDHMWLVGQRDLLKTAADSAAMAATLKLAALPAAMSDDEVRAALWAVARRYVSINVLGNLPDGARERARNTLRVTVSVDRAAGTVDVAAEADLGGTLLAKRFFGYYGPENGIQQRAGVESAMVATELVLALDATRSMNREMPGRRARLEVVRTAALDLIDILESRGGAAPLAVGLVPWHFMVQLGAETREAWERDGRAVYLRERYYPFPQATAGRPWCSSNARFPCTGPGTTSALPPQPEAWRGCVDQRSFDGGEPLALSTVTPRDAPVAMRFWSAQVPNPIQVSVAYDCATEGGRQNDCYNGQATLQSQYRRSPQYPCLDDDYNQSIVPLTTDLARVRAAVSGLVATGSNTYSTLGVVWGMRLLSPSWREAWGGTAHPMETTVGNDVRKVLVLLTDGEDNRWDRDAVEDHRDRACTRAKAAGITVFTIAAMDESHHAHDRLAEQLEACSSQADDPAGRYVFVNNATPEDLEAAFLGITRQLLAMRRVY